MTPEEKARVRIDQWLNDAGWTVINRDEFSRLAHTLGGEYIKNPLLDKRNNAFL